MHTTTHIERQNLRKSNWCYTRRTNVFSKKVQNLDHSLHLYFSYYNFVMYHSAIWTLPAVRAGIMDCPASIEWLAEETEKTLLLKRPKIYNNAAWNRGYPPGAIPVHHLSGEGWRPGLT